MNNRELSSIFESSNARSLSSGQLTSEFIWTESFDFLFSEQNQVILGSRGSGKTALVKMLSHDNLSKLSSKYSKANDAIENKRFIATYVPLKVEWVNSLNNFESKKDSYFNWSMNLSVCARLIDTLRSCIDTYVEGDIQQLKLERDISKELSNIWLDNEITNNLASLRTALERIEYRKNISFNKESMGIPLSDEEKMIGIAFHTSLFKPFEMATKTAHRILSLPFNCKWYLCIDEAEFLSLEHHKLLNTHMRSASDIVFKITTMPYRHHTLDTDVVANVNVGHDLEYVYIDKLGTSHLNQQKADRIIQDFAENLFINRLKYFGLNELTLESLIGRSALTQSTSELTDKEKLLDLVNQHCNDSTVDRANELFSSNGSGFDDAIARKLRGLLLLREEYNNRSGNTTSVLYSGTAIVSRCSDGNPRRLFRLFNHLLCNLNTGSSRISESSQSERLKSYAYRELEVIKFEKSGKKSFELINKIGGYFKHWTLVEKLSADIPQSFTVNQSISNETWGYIKTAVDLGLIYPYTKKDINSRSLFPSKEGRFVLANCLAPNFNIFPRVGRSVELRSILNYSISKKIDTEQMPLDLDYED